jgi:hypothetical protein
MPVFLPPDSCRLSACRLTSLSYSSRSGLIN